MSFEAIKYELRFISLLDVKVDGRWKGRVYSRHSGRLSSWSFWCRGDAVAMHIDGFPNMEDNSF
eukprot:11811721-Ditylum_brightwellii.AAC.2